MNRVPPIIDPIAVGSTALPLLVFDANTGQYVPGAASSVAAPGSDTWVIFNDGGFFGADAGLSYDKTNNRLSINGGASGQAAYLGMTVNAGARGVITKNATTDLSGYAFIHYGSADEPYLYANAAGSPRSPYVAPRFPAYEGFSYHTLDFQTSGEVWMKMGSVGSTTNRFGYIDASNSFKIFDSSATGYALFSVSSGGDLTITPSGGDVEIAGTLNVTGALTAGSKRVLRSLSINTTDSTTITTSAAENNFDRSYSVPAGLLNVAGNALNVRVHGKQACTGTPTLTIRLKAGSTVLFVVTAMRMTTTSQRWSAEFVVKCTATGASGTLETTAGVQFVGANVGTAAKQSATVDLTAGITLQVSGQMSVSDAANTMTLETLEVEAINC